MIWASKNIPAYVTDTRHPGHYENTILGDLRTNLVTLIQNCTKTNASDDKIEIPMGDRHFTEMTQILTNDELISKNYNWFSFFFFLEAYARSWTYSSIFYDVSFQVQK